MVQPFIVSLARLSHLREKKKPVEMDLVTMVFNGEKKKRGEIESEARVN